MEKWDMNLKIGGRIKMKLEKLTKKKIIKYLSMDPIFGIYNRQYMNYLLENKKFGKVWILDFENIGKLNANIGYNKVNKKFKKIFKKKYKKVYIGRFFSGDEILILSNKNNIIDKIGKRSQKQGLGFTHFEHKRGNLNKVFKKLKDKDD